MPNNQIFKAVYFPDYRTVNPNAKGFILAFGKRNKDLYQIIAPFSSHEVRELLGTNSFVELERTAEKEGLPVSTYCVWRIRKAIERSSKELSVNSARINQGEAGIKPIHVTFKGGKQNPLHNWY